MSDDPRVEIVARICARDHFHKISDATFEKVWVDYPHAWDDLAIRILAALDEQA